MRWLRFAAIVLLTTILQTSLVDVIAVTSAGIKPNLLLVLLVFFAVHSSPTDAVLASFAIGLAADIIAPTTGIMGPQIIGFGLLGTLLNDLHRVIAIRRPLYQALAIFATGLLAAVLAYLVTYLRAQPAGSSIFVEAFWRPLYSAVVGPFLFVPVRWWMHMKRKRSRNR